MHETRSCSRSDLHYISNSDAKSREWVLLYYTILYYTIPCQTILYHAILHYTAAVPSVKEHTKQLVDTNVLQR